MAYGSLINKKKRLDSILVEKGLAASRERAAALILSGNVIVDNRVVSKAGFQTSSLSIISLLKKDIKYVSRGGVKLEGAIDHFNINVTGKTAIDIGASTGGFTDCLLTRNTKKVYAIDVGYGQFDWRLRNDPRVTIYERKNIRFIRPSDLPEKVDIVVIDVSFISLKLVIPPAINLLKENGEILALIKPQFEVGKGEVGKGGVVKEPEKHKKAIDSVSLFCTESGLNVVGVSTSKLPGPKGNIEFFIYLKTH